MQRISSQAVPVLQASHGVTDASLLHILVHQARIWCVTLMPASPNQAGYFVTGISNAWALCTTIGAQ
jgi:hypothetical protein